MKKTCLFLTILTLLLVSAFAVAAQNNLYNVDGSTYSVTDQTTITNTAYGYIGLANVKVKQIWINNGSGNAQTVTIYENGNSTSTVAKVMAFSVPATIGCYQVFPIANSTQMGVDADLIDIPYFVVRTSTSTTPVNITVEYKTP